MYKIGDIVLVKSRGGPAIPPVHVRLVKEVVEDRTAWGMPGWEGELAYEEEAKMLAKDWSIPYKYPDQIETFVFESDIIEKVS